MRDLRPLIKDRLLVHAEEEEAEEGGEKHEAVVVVVDFLSPKARFSLPLPREQE
jgi:hypothetical protein